MTASIHPVRDLPTQYVLRPADTCLILSQRLASGGCTPIIEEDIAITNMALDLGSVVARGLLTLAGQMNQRAGGE
ncbi:MAG: hypothetical protein IPP44_14650 [Ideonella sp.]|nr:hypothetical protein [Ideonella sp.]